MVGVSASRASKKPSAWTDAAFGSVGDDGGVRGRVVSGTGNPGKKVERVHECPVRTQA